MNKDYCSCTLYDSLPTTTVLMMTSLASYIRQTLQQQKTDSHLLMRPPSPRYPQVVEEQSTGARLSSRVSDLDDELVVEV